ncbi:PHD finger protein 3 [Papilio xuthus]|uniref:PHD finger protein 3 n=1 Tax=Papilio xuthus TaxID=66420 RepID=A0A194PQF3_PAPXU|nr:PHD finger protein 3 [Papilio xuthus]
MANTVITNYTDLNGPSSKSDSSVVVIVNKDGSLSVDQNLLGTLMGTDGSQSAGISVVRVGHEGRPDDATDSENDDDKIPHVTLSVDSYYDEPNSIIKYDSGAEMLQSLRIETRENSLVGFQNDHCYTSLTSPSQVLPQGNEAFIGFEDPVIEITRTPIQKPIQSNKKITILEQQIIPKGKKIIINPAEASVILKGNDLLHKPLPVFTKSKQLEAEKKAEVEKKHEENTDSSSISSSSESAPDRDSDSDYKDTKDRSLSMKLKKNKIKPRILKSSMSLKETKSDVKTPKPKANRSIVRRDIREKIQQKNAMFEKKEVESAMTPNKESLLSPVTTGTFSDQVKVVPKQVQKVIKKEKKTPAHVTALLSDMTSLFSTPDVIRRVSTDTKVVSKPEKDSVPTNKKLNLSLKSPEIHDAKVMDSKNDISEKLKSPVVQKTYLKQSNKIPTDKPGKSFDAIPQLDDASLAQILQDTATTPMKIQPNIPSNASPGLAGPLLPSLDLSDLQPIEEGLPEDVLMHVAQLVESSENLQEVIDKQVLGKVDTLSKMQPLVPSTIPQHSPGSMASSLQMSKTMKTMLPKKDPIEIVRRDGRVITLPPIEAPATRASKRKSQVESTGSNIGTPIAAAPLSPVIQTPEPVLQHVSKQYVNRKLSTRKQETIPLVEEPSAESQESLNSEDDPNRLWCICKQPHNNRFMICCDSCQDWFHGKCVNITKAMGQQMEDQGIEWRCPNCVKSIKTKTNKVAAAAKNVESHETRSLAASILPKDTGSKTNCIVCKKAARASSIYCSDACILKHAQDSLGSQASKTDEAGPEKIKAESRVIVYERKSGRLLAGPNAPTAENLKLWLQKNPTFEVVRPGTLSTIKPNPSRKKSAGEANKIQTTLNFERLPKKQSELLKQGPHDYKEKISIKPVIPKEEPKPLQTKFLATPKSIPQPQIIETPKSHNTAPVTRTSESRKTVRALNRSQSSNEKTPSVTPTTPRRKDVSEPRMKLTSAEPIRDNVKKALQEQMSIRMAETSGPKFTEDEILQFAIDTEFELHELFRDVGMKYKAKYRSLMFNIKDRKNLSLWQKICDRTITPQQLVRLSPEELASQELAQWRDKEVKHSLELIKKSELDLLAANKTYVLKTHKGEEVMETKESVSTELDPNVPVEDVVSALNDSMGNEQAMEENKDTTKKTDSVSHKSGKKHGSSKKKDKENGISSHSKSKRESKKDVDSRNSRSSRRKSTRKEKEDRRRRSDRKSRSRSQSRSRADSNKDKVDSSETSKTRSRSRLKSKRRSKDSVRSTSRERDRSRSSGRSRRRSRSRESSRRRSRSKHRQSTEDKVKHRSKSQENTYKSKNDSTDSDSIERPKSAMLKETHPEYDPHEPMITSAFSEEDLRKSREDVYDDYKNEITNYSVTDYDPSKSFSINTSIMPTNTYLPKHDKAPEVESDQEPSSTVENSAPIVWNGCINMVDVARFYVAAHEVSGNAMDLEEDLAAELDVVGRINPETVWDYILKMKRAGNKDIVILRLQAANDEEKMQYIALYSYLSSRNRLGVVKVSNTATVKDFYIVPLSANSSLPPVLLPLDGPGLEVKTHLLIAIVIRQRKKRLPPIVPKEIIPAKMIGESRKRSYTPPVGGRGFTPPSSPKRRALPLPTYSSSPLSTSVKDKIAATLASADDEEAYSPGSSTSSGSAPATSSLRTKMEELNRQIEEQKMQILKMAQADSSIIDHAEEAYSPSRPMTPPEVEAGVGGAASAMPLADIALPSNLQEILASIKQRTPAAAAPPAASAADVDMRQLPPA